MPLPPVALLVGWASCRHGAGEAVPIESGVPAVQIEVIEGEFDLAAASASVTGGPGERVGRSVAGAGDLDGDGVADVVIGGEGRALAFLDSWEGTAAPFATLTGGAGAGRSVAAAGDADSDGRSEIAVAGEGDGRGRVWITEVEAGTAALDETAAATWDGGAAGGPGVRP